MQLGGLIVRRPRTTPPPAIPRSRSSSRHDSTARRYSRCAWTAPTAPPERWNIAEDEIGGRIVRVLPDGSGVVVVVPATANSQKPEGSAFGDFNHTVAPGALRRREVGRSRHAYRRRRKRHDARNLVAVVETGRHSFRPGWSSVRRDTAAASFASLLMTILVFALGFDSVEGVASRSVTASSARSKNPRSGARV